MSVDHGDFNWSFESTSEPEDRAAPQEQREEDGKTRGGDNIPQRRIRPTRKKTKTLKVRESQETLESQMRSKFITIDVINLAASVHCMK